MKDSTYILGLFLVGISLCTYDVSIICNHLVLLHKENAELKAQIKELSNQQDKTQSCTLPSEK